MPQHVCGSVMTGTGACCMPASRLAQGQRGSHAEQRKQALLHLLPQQRKMPGTHHLPVADRAGSRSRHRAHGTTARFRACSCRLRHRGAVPPACALPLRVCALMATCTATHTCGTPAATSRRCSISVDQSPCSFQTLPAGCTTMLPPSPGPVSLLPLSTSLQYTRLVQIPPQVVSPG